MTERDDARLVARAHELRERAAALAKPIVEAAADSTTVATERAVLRLFGVTGLAPTGRPLALEVVDRFAQLGPGRLAGGIGLPFAAAALEYDLDPQQLATAIALGHVDLGLEVELLHEQEKRAAADASVAEWLDSAWERLDANRTARSELLDVLGDRPIPWIGADLEPSSAGDAAQAAWKLVETGADLIRTRVPRDRELRQVLGEEVDPATDAEAPAQAPAGSQRGLTLLRAALDEMGAEHGRYIRLATRALGLAAPEHAVVAGFERVDIVYVDPVESIVELGVDPDRAFADHLFALELLRRSGSWLALGPGPVALAPELASGMPPSWATRSGRALAMQALSVEIALSRGLEPERILIGAVPRDLLTDAASLQLGLPEVSLRRLLFQGHPLVFEESEGVGSIPGWWVYLTAWTAGNDLPALVLRQAPSVEQSGSLADVRRAAEAGSSLSAGRELGGLTGEALTHAGATLDAALETVRSLAGNGWAALLEEWNLPLPHLPRLGAEGRVDRRGYHDPFAGSIDQDRFGVLDVKG
ncbi:MAG: hypothetical protein H0X16_01310 [Chloroflexi bacterium]|nr:hypothetical protein [Chloroflexota bacterium]